MRTFALVMPDAQDQRIGEEVPLLKRKAPSWDVLVGSIEAREAGAGVFVPREGQSGAIKA